MPMKIPDMALDNFRYIILMMLSKKTTQRFEQKKFK